MSEMPGVENSASGGGRGKRRNFYRGGRGRRGRGGFRDGGFSGSYNRYPSSHHPNYPKRAKFEVTKRLKEVNIGVTEFVGTHERLNGIVKERFNDFHVHEIDMNGERCQLTNQDIPPPPDDALDLTELKKNLPQETFDQIESLSNPDADINTIEIDVTDLDKDQRRMLHTIGKKIPSVISHTIEKDQKKLLVLAKHDKKHPVKFYKDKRSEWAYNSNFCHFLLHKVNIDTMDALNLLAMHLHIRPNLFNYAGTKDRRARTTQWVSIKRIPPASILEAGKRVRGAFAGNFKFSKEPLSLGQLKGNHFTIALRNMTATDEQIDSALSSLRDNGFINYYGLQRFGTVASVPTHEVGKTLLQSNWNEAIELILKPRSGEFPDMTEAREIWSRTKDAKAALSKIRRQDKIEAKLLRGIIQCGASNPQGALDALPRNARTMYIHSYQSFVWNHLVSRRIKELGRKPIVGDLVYDGGVDHDVPEVVEEGIELLEEGLEKDKGVGEAEVKVKVEPTGDGVDEVKDEDVTEGEEKKNDAPLERDFRPLPPVKMLTEEDLGNYTLADVIMPQPGWRVTYPSYAKEWYEEFLKEDGLTTDLRQKNQKYSLGGQYRKILQVPEELTWKIVHYSALQADLILSDIERMKNHELPKDEPEGKYKALILEMTLNSSTYATMALREILKHDTSPETQAAQSAAHHAQDEKDRKDEAEEKGEVNGEGEDEEVKPEIFGEEKEESVADEATEEMEIAGEADNSDKN